MFEIKVVSLLSSPIHKAGKGKKAPVYQAVEEIVHQAFPRGFVNNATHMKVDNYFGVARICSTPHIEPYQEHVLHSALKSFGDTACASCHRCRGQAL